MPDLGKSRTLENSSAPKPGKQLLSHPLSCSADYFWINTEAVPAVKSASRGA